MQQREKILAVLLGAVVILWFGMPIFNRIFVEPIQQLETERDNALRDSQTRVQQQLALAKRGKILTDWRRTSLPPNQNDAARLYAEWLFEIAQMSGFSDVEVILSGRSSKEDTFIRIPVTINADGTLQELAHFLERFESVDLLHRIRSCEIKSPQSEGNPDLGLVITAEGLAVQSAPPRSDLFPQVPIADALEKDATSVTLKGEVSDFPKQAPFRVRIGDEFVNVTEISSTENGGTRWTLQRGVARTFADNHPQDATVELYPLVPESEATQEQVQDLWRYSLFTKPGPEIEYNPRLAENTIPPAIRDREYKHKFQVAGWNPVHGDPRFTLLQHPEGMDIDERTGEITWKVPAGAEMGERPVELVVWGSASKDAGFANTLNLRVRDPNVAPKLESEEPVRFFLGRQSQVRLRGVDPDGDSSRLTYRLENPQPGMTIGTNDGIIRWTAPETMDAQTIPLRITLIDSDELPQSTTVNIEAKVEEDSARFAYLTSSLVETRNDDEVKRRAWIFDRATNKNTTITEGEKFTIADFEMTVAEIGPDFVKLRRDSGLYELKFGQPLVAMVKLDVPLQDYSPQPAATETPAGDSPMPSGSDTPVSTETSDSDTNETEQSTETSVPPAAEQPQPDVQP